MNSIYDVAIIGSGAMGSAAAYHLSKAGLKMLVLDQYEPPHHFGSSHGESRIIREAYFESPLYVPLVQQAYHLWNDLERVSGKKLFLKTGGLMIGNKDDRVFRGAANSAEQFGITYEYLDQEEIEKRFPGFNPSSETVALFEKNAGILFPEECIRTQIELSKNEHIDFHFHEKALSITIDDDRIEIITDKSKYTAHKIIISSGAWLTTLMPELHLPLEVKRQVLFWFKYPGSDIEKFSPAHFPIYIWEYDKNKIFYGFPDIGQGIKIAIHHRGQLTTADTVNRIVSTQEIKEIETILRTHFIGSFTFDHSEVCMYTNTPDEDFIIDFHPSSKNIIIASPCSGHGFKFSSAIGKILSEMILEKSLSFDISVFNINRLFSKKNSGS